MVATTMPINMKKLVVSKNKYFLYSAIFYTIITSGLIWQVTQISINFFKYEVVSDINISMPEADNDTYYLNVCFNSDEFYNKSVMNELQLKYNPKTVHTSRPLVLFANYELNLGERFNLLPNVFNQMIGSGYTMLNTPPYIVGSKVCKQSKQDQYSYTYIQTSILENTSNMYVSYSSLFPYVDVGRMQIVSNLPKGSQSIGIFVTKAYYTLSKLKCPYSDHCIDYTTSRSEAIATCENLAHMIKYKKLSPTKLFSINDKKILNKTILSSVNTSFYRKCQYQYPKDDCIKKNIFTSFSMQSPSFVMINPNHGILIFKEEESNEPSFIVESKPRIDDIDFITYIFGAVGTWLGISFVTFNPIPYVMEVAKSITNTSIEIGHGDNMENVATDRHTRSQRLDSNRLSIQKLQFKYQELNREMVAMKNIMGYLMERISAPIG